MRRTQIRCKEAIPSGAALLLMTLLGVWTACSDAPTQIETQGTGEGGSVAFAVPLSKPAAADLARAEVVITAADMDTIRQDLTISDQQITGTVEGIPAGNTRRFTVNGFDATGTLAYTGSAFVNMPEGEVVPVSITIRRVGVNGRVWFLSPKTPGDADDEIWSMEPDGSDARREVELTYGSTYGHFAVKPDGSEIAFVHSESSYDGPYKLKVRRVAGGLASEIFDAGSMTIRSVSWSPDGGELAFSLYSQYYEDELVVLDMQSLSVSYRGPLDVDSFGSQDFISRVEWALDGTRLLITGGSGIWGQYYMMESDGSGLRVVATTGDMGPVLPSPDGTRIAYAREGKGVFLANPDGTRETQVSSQEAYYVRWSPDGKELFFDNAPSTRALYRIRVDGSDLQGVEPQGAAAFVPWFPVWATR